MFTKKLLQIAMVLALAVGLFTPSLKTQPPSPDSCNSPQQSQCGGG